MSTVVDPLGRTVHLTPERWEHIVNGHPYMAPHRAEVLRAVQEPTERIAQPRSGHRTGSTWRAQAPVGGSRS